MLIEWLLEVVGCVAARLDPDVSGVYSLSTATPVKTGNFDLLDKDFAGTTSYQDWRFVYMGRMPGNTTEMPVKK